MKLTDFSSLADAQAHTITGTKMISPDMMVAFITSFQLVNTIMTGTTNEAKGFQLGIQLGSEFNFINGHPAAVTSLLAKLVVDGIVTQAFQDYCVAYANPMSKPYENSTQADWDAQVALDTVGANPTTLQEATYVGGQHLVPVRHDKVKVKITVLEVDAIANADSLIVTAFSKNVDETVYSEEDIKRGNFSIPANWFGTKTFVVNHSNLQLHIQLKLTSKYNRTFTAEAFTA